MSDVPKPDEIEIPSEKDKPFILALTSVGLFAGEIIAAVYAAIFHPTADMSTLKEAMTATIGFMGTAWTFYLIRKNKDSTE